MTYELTDFPQFEEVPQEQLDWLTEHLEIVEIPKGGYLFEKGSPIDHLTLVFEGDFELYFQQNNSRKSFGRIRKHDISGLLPYSRAKNAGGFAVAIQPAVIGTLNREKLHELIGKYYELTEVLVHEMNNRIRNITQIEVQNEKLIALGKLSAGLAHELNNPASAMVRSASLLQQHLKGLPADFKKVIKIRADDEAIDKINQFMYQKLEEKSSELSMLEQNTLEDDLYDWFSECSLEDRYDLVPLLVEYQFNTDDLLFVKSCLRDEDFNPVLKWIVQNMTTHKTVTDIKEASSRIETLVQSVKTYSYMDQSLDFQMVDIHTGIKSTLNVLNHKITKVGHKITTEFDENVPQIHGLPGELNQVWTNLIDNAIDALPKEGGELKVKTKAAGSFVYVFVEDNGHGISEEHLTRIFEPFFTTKEIGKGTGLGLDVAMKIIKQHNGQLKVTSQPGKTIFEVCLPINHNIEEENT
ncbi:ATP-binding protein [Flagellimonas allohymeniacidonis]|uniref:histidine kinase n=1 Tax=Flagellimonas allohymeniacidonis TaxID=2517819 RepID=A0A4Q8QA16_9FLAO|nr:ATP-binding protein [Allomuricauda hymeniacidonis]TAI47132.1 cyclic nucleotide-binding domain-containing protein [Allomuricauda hymeniacidonis]